MDGGETDPFDCDVAGLRQQLAPGRAEWLFARIDLE
jgi:hypothetical protein